VRVAIDAERIGDALDAQVQVERVLKGVMQPDPEIAEPDRDCAFRGGVIGHVRVRRVFDIADQPVIDVGRFLVGPAIDGMHPDLRLVLAGVVDDLADEGRELVDGQAGAVFLRALLDDVGRPLLPEAGELEVFQPIAAVL
jgi:hypothetical protein